MGGKRRKIFLHSLSIIVQVVSRNHVSTIVALSNSYSGTSYWPSNGTQQYGRFMARTVIVYIPSKCAILYLLGPTGI